MEDKAKRAIEAMEAARQSLRGWNDNDEHQLFDTPELLRDFLDTMAHLDGLIDMFMFLFLGNTYGHLVHTMLQTLEGENLDKWAGRIKGDWVSLLKEQDDA